MTAAASLARLPLAAGGVLFEITGTAIHWSVARYMRAPLANTAILAMTTLTAMAASNALYLQRHEHPAPLFGPPVGQEIVAEPVPVVPATRRQTFEVVAPLPEAETTGSVNDADAVTIGNAEVTEIQRKLHAIQLYDGAIDGLYGPRTARAIKAFEKKLGMAPRGELTLEVLEAVRAAPVILPEASDNVLPKPEPHPVTSPKAEAEAAGAPPATTFKAVADKPTTVTELAPLPEPAPLVTTVEVKPQADAGAHVPRRQLPQSPEEALDVAVEAAGDAIDTIISGVQTMAMTTPGKKQPAEAREGAAASTSGVAAAPVVETAASQQVVQTAATEEPKPGVPLALEKQQGAAEIAVLDTDARPEDLMPPFSVTDPAIVAKVQRGLASLGFLQGPADGIAGEATAKAIRNFEVYYNYDVTGRISPELLDLLVENGASL